MNRKVKTNFHQNQKYVFLVIDPILSDEILNDQACYQDLDLPYKHLLQKCVKPNWKESKHGKQLV